MTVERECIRAAIRQLVGSLTSGAGDLHRPDPRPFAAGQGTIWSLAGLREIDGAREAVHALGSDPTIAEHFGKLLWLGNSGAQMTPEATLAATLNRLLPIPAHPDAADEHYARVFGELFDFFGSDPHDAEFVAPLLGFSSDASHIEVSDLTIEPLPARFQAYFASAALSVVGDSLPVTHCLHATASFPKVLIPPDRIPAAFREDPRDEVNEWFTRQVAVARRAQYALHLVAEGGCEVGAFGLHGRSWASPNQGTWHTLYVVGGRRMGSRMHLQSAQVPDLQSLLSNLASLDLSGLAFLDTALARFADASNRARYSDAIVDLMIGAEALFLGNDNGELRFRLASRAAWFLGDSLDERQNVFDLMYKAYGIRSKIVHGDSSRRSQAAPNVRPQLSGLMRRALKKAITDTLQHGKMDSQYWNSLVLGGRDS